MSKSDKRNRRIGIMVGREWSWPPAFIEEVARRDAGVTAEFVQLGAPRLDDQIPYDVVIDRISHEVPFYRTWLKHALVQGVRVINNPLMWTADDKFFGATLAEANDIRSPKTIVLPNKDYIPGIKHDESLRNLVFPLDWQGVIDHIGLPCILKDAHGGGWRDVYVCRTIEELLYQYDRSALLTMIVQEFIEWDEFVRCICIGREHIQPIKYDPKERKYHDSDDFLEPEMRETIVKQSRKLCRALGYDMNSIEFAIRDGVPYAIDFMNPAPDFDVNSLGKKWFDWVVKTMADVTIEMALEEREVPKPKAPNLFRGHEEEGVTAEPVREWHDLLDASLALESAGWLEARQRDRGLAFGERPLCTVLRPRFLRADEYDALRTASHALLGAFRTAGAAAVTDRAFRGQFRLNDWEHVLLESSPALHVAAPLSRLDAFIDPSDGVARITEYNGETPAGAGYGDALAEIFLGMPVMRRFLERWTVRPLPARHLVLGVLLETWHRFRGVRTAPSIAIVDWDDVPTISEFNLSRDYFQSMGYACVITTPDALTYEGGVLRDAGKAIDVIYKRVLIHELIQECGIDHAMVRAVRDGAVCMVNPFHCKPLHKKASLAVLSDERNASRFSAAERDAIATHVPWTRVVEERKTLAGGATVDLVPHILAEREQLVLKPNDDYGGAGIVLGWEVDDSTWGRAVQSALVEPHIVQRRIALPSEPFPAIADGGVAFDDRIVDTAPFCWHGAFMDGLLTRISTSTLVNVTAGGGSTVPTFVVEPR